MDSSDCAASSLPVSGHGAGSPRSSARSGEWSAGGIGIGSGTSAIDPLPTSATAPKIQMQRRGPCSMVGMSAFVVLVIAALAVILAIGLAYLPLRLVVGHIARNVRALIERQRERRGVQRATIDRRKL